MNQPAILVPLERIERSILLIRGEKVMLDSDLAEIYDVTTKRLNEQVKRNASRFPPDFMFQLTESEKTEVVANWVEEEDRIAHRLAAPLASEGAVAGEIDWTRRFDHMQQHSGQHLLSAVFEELFGLHTVSFHLGAESATIDLEGGPVETRTVVEAERRANQVVSENRAVDVRFEDASEAQGLRKASERAGTLRIVSIDGLDRSACGGTHVRTTGEIGPILLRRTEKIRQSVRLEFAQQLGQQLIQCS